MSDFCSVLKGRFAGAVRAKVRETQWQLVTAVLRADSRGSVEPFGDYVIEQECWGYFDKE